MGIMRVTVSQGMVTMVRFREGKPSSDLARLPDFSVVSFPGAGLRLGMVWFMEASVPVLENILEGPSPWSKVGLLPFLLELSPFHAFSGVLFPQRYLSGVEFGPPIKPTP